MTFNRSVPPNTLLPHIVYPNVEEAIAWLTKAFGFREHYRYGDPVSGAQMHIGDAWIMLKRARSGLAIPAELGGQTQTLTVFVEDLDVHFQRAKSAGAKIVEEPNESIYGEHQYAAEDLAGHHWLFSSHARDMNPADWGAAVAEPVAAAPQLSPMLSVRRGSAAIDFYKEAFGAKVLFRLDGDGGSIVAELSVGNSRFWVADESPEYLNFSPESLGGGSVRMVLTVSNPDAVFQQAVAAGASAVRPVEDQPYGWRVGRVADPFGHHWEIGKPL